MSPYYILGLLYVCYGDFERALEAATQLATLGDATGDRRFQTNAAFTAAWAYTARGEWEMGIEAHQQALAYSPDAFETAIVLGQLGYAYLEKGDIAKAISVLEQAVQQANQYRSRQVQGIFTTWLGEACFLDDQIERARDLVQQGLAISLEVRYGHGIGWAQRVLGRIAQARGDFVEATTHLQEALHTFASLPARFEVGRTQLDLATFAHIQGNQTAAVTHLVEAYTVFRDLRVPRYVERAEQLARDWGVSLAEGSA